MCMYKKVYKGLPGFSMSVRLSVEVTLVTGLRARVRRMETPNQEGSSILTSYYQVLDPWFRSWRQVNSITHPKSTSTYLCLSITTMQDISWLSLNQVSWQRLWRRPLGLYDWKSIQVSSTLSSTSFTNHWTIRPRSRELGWLWKGRSRSLSEKSKPFTHFYVICR